MPEIPKPLILNLDSAFYSPTQIISRNPFRKSIKLQGYWSILNINELFLGPVGSGPGRLSVWQITSYMGVSENRGP